LGGKYQHPPPEIDMWSKSDNDKISTTSSSSPTTPTNNTNNNNNNNNNNNSNPEETMSLTEVEAALEEELKKIPRINPALEKLGKKKQSQGQTHILSKQ